MAPMLMFALRSSLAVKAASIYLCMSKMRLGTYLRDYRLYNLRLRVDPKLMFEVIGA